jgi:hypothetical protein
MQPILMVWSVYAEAMRVPVVSLMMAARVMGRFCCLVSWRLRCRYITERTFFLRAASN